MNKVNQMRSEQIDDLQNKYGECKIEKDELIEGLMKLGIYTTKELDEHTDYAEEVRYEYKLSQAKGKEKQYA